MESSMTHDKISIDHQNLEVYAAQSSGFNTENRYQEPDNTNNIDVQKIVKNLNYFPNRPMLLSANPVTKEDLSWGESRSKTKDIKGMVEDKGYYEHLTLFLEDNIAKNDKKETNNAITPYIDTIEGRIFYVKN